jgi:hypothetical protein
MAGDLRVKARTASYFHKERAHRQERIAMARVICCSILGAIVAGVILAIVASSGSPLVVSVPIPLASGAISHQDISLASIISKIAVILGVCTGALTGALAGVAGGRTPHAEPHAARSGRL